MSRGAKLRRSPHLMSYWTDEGMVTWNYAAGAESVKGFREGLQKSGG